MSLDGGPFVSETGLHVTHAATLSDIWPIDTLIIPGGVGVRQERAADATDGGPTGDTDAKDLRC